MRLRTSSKYWRPHRAKISHCKTPTQDCHRHGPTLRLTPRQLLALARGEPTEETIELAVQLLIDRGYVRGSAT